MGENVKGWNLWVKSILPWKLKFTPQKAAIISGNLFAATDL